VDFELLLTAVGVMTFCLSLLLATFLLVVRGRLRSANRYLAGFFILTAVDVIGWAAALFPSALADVLIFRLPLAYLQMPLLYAYAATLCFPGRRSGLPLLAGVAAAVAGALALVPRALAMIAPDQSPVPWVASGADMVAQTVALHVQFYIYAALMVLLLLRYRETYRRTRSNPDDLTFIWLSVLVAVSVAAHTLVLAKALAWLGGRADAPILELVVGLVAVAITCAITMAALFRQDLFLGVADEPRDPAPRPADMIRPGPDPQAIARLERYMTEQEPFLDPSLSIRALARRMGMGQRELSNLINQQMGVHFFDFVNRYRIDKAAALLADPAQADTSILEIALQSGFNTKSSFNAAFSRHRGETPTAHRLRARAVA
jgi:AraC-like DNA-binding protein